ncbi:hypothetical protein JHD48_00895 [Sulfurimonas sp. SAG-AH-194-I05]|nr:fatty acid desaturase CarF family protein [Sulfurimonas sp. SAG-AH-194-I05]MDF1874285.1 hypothetical protein [Sulfurimonas sp. SAG-AH-194-I05]
MSKYNLKEKQEAFSEAMRSYHSSHLYQKIYTFVSVVNISLQIVLLYIATTLSFGLIWVPFIVVVSYFITDFINGLVHLYMDHNEGYNSFFGPFIASFHLHHKKPEYTDNNLFMIYFNESGPKFWLIFYLLFVFLLSFLEINPVVLSIFILVGFLSSVAEVSHYLCHNSKSKSVLFLQNIGLLLSMKHHKKHHNEDNNGYAFLNGMSDVFIDKIAKRYYAGYKENSDKHFEFYKGMDTANRA